MNIECCTTKLIQFGILSNYSNAIWNTVSSFLIQFEWEISNHNNDENHVCWLDGVSLTLFFSSSLPSFSLSLSFFLSLSLLSSFSPGCVLSLMAGGNAWCPRARSLSLLSVRMTGPLFNGLLGTIAPNQSPCCSKISLFFIVMVEFTYNLR